MYKYNGHFIGILWAIFLKMFDEINNIIIRRTYLLHFLLIFFQFLVSNFKLKYLGDYFDTNLMGRTYRQTHLKSQQKLQPIFS